MTEQSDFDVLIVGGGAVGGTLAIQLQGMGYRVAMVEHSQPVFDSTNPERVIALSWGSRCHLHALGIWEGIASRGAGAIRHIMVSEPGNIGQVDMDAADAMVDGEPVDALGYVVEMGHVLAAVYDKLDDVCVFSQASVRDIRQLEQGLEVHIEQSGQSQILRTSLLVGADGQFSQVRRMAGIQSRGWDHNRFALVASVQTSRGHGDVAYECFRKDGPLAFLPLADDRSSIVWTLPPRDAYRLSTLPEMAFIRALEKAAGADVIGRLGRVEACGQRACFPLELRLAASFAASRTVLVGNAAHTVHPVAGQGMNLGLRDIASLCAVLDSPMARQDAGSPILLSAYAEQRRADVLATCSFTEGLVITFGNELAPLRWLRGHAMNGMQMWPQARDWLLRQAAGIAQMTVAEKRS